MHIKNARKICCHSKFYVYFSHVAKILDVVQGFNDRTLKVAKGDSIARDSGQTTSVEQIR
jgi:hypothetical protein